MYVVTVSFIIKSGQMDVFLPLMLENASLSLSHETGCVRFDVCTSNANSDEIILYEIYDDEAAFKAHLTMPHFKNFSDKVKDMVADKLVKTGALIS